MKRLTAAALGLILLLCLAGFDKADPAYAPSNQSDGKAGLVLSYTWYDALFLSTFNYPHYTFISQRRLIKKLAYLDPVATSVTPYESRPDNSKIKESDVFVRRESRRTLTIWSLSNSTYAGQRIWFCMQLHWEKGDTRLRTFKNGGVDPDKCSSEASRSTKLPSIVL